MMHIPEWKWERIDLDFVVRFPRTLGEFDVKWIIVNWLTKFLHFISVQTTYNTQKLAKIYIREIVRLHRVLISILQIEVLNLHLIFGGLCRRIWILEWTLVHPFTLRLMVSLNRLFRFWGHVAGGCDWL